MNKEVTSARRLKFIVFMLFMLYSTGIINAQPTTFEWVQTQGGKRGIPVVSDVATDANGNVYTVGKFSGTVDFDPGSGVYEITPAVNVSETFIMKYDNGGNFGWALNFGGNVYSSAVNASSVAVDASGNIIVTGTFYGVIDFDPGAGVYNLNGSSGNINQFILKLSSSGSLIWAKALGGATGQSISLLTLEIDNAGNLIFAGQYNGTFDFDPGAAIYIISTNYQIVISKFDDSGNFLWVQKSINYPNMTSVISVSFDSINNIVLSGIFTGTTDFDPGSGVYNLTMLGYADVFILKLDQLGNFMWVKQIGGNYYTKSGSMDTDASGNIYITGTFEDICDVDPGISVVNLISSGYRDVFILKLDVSGNFVWAGKAGGTSEEVFGDLKVDGPGNVYFSGHFIGTCDVNPGSGVYQFVSVYYNDIFVCKLNSSGTFQWAKQIGGVLEDGLVSLSLDPFSNILATGFFAGKLNFNPGTAANSVIGTGRCIFVSKFDTNGNYGWTMVAGESSAVHPMSTSTDVFGNVYTTGSFFGTVDFNDGPGVFNMTSVIPDTIHDIFICKHNAAGNLIFAKQLSGPSRKIAHDIDVDIFGNCFITGRFTGTVDFDPGNPVYLLDAGTNEEAFALKLDGSGGFVWVKKLECSQSGYARSASNAIELDVNGNIYLAGLFNGDVDFDPGSGVFLMNGVATSAFILKLNQVGNLVWAKKIGSTQTYFGVAYSLDVDNSGNVIASGWFYGTFDFDPGPGIYNLTTTGNDNAFIVKLNSGGDFVWAAAFRDYYGSFAYNIQHDGFGNVFVSGSFNNILDADPGSGIYNLTSPNDNMSTFLLKLDSSGQFLWAKCLPGLVHSIFYDSNYYSSLKNMHVNSDGFSLLALSLVQTQDVDPGPDTLTMTGSCTPLILRFDPLGNLVYANNLYFFSVTGNSTGKATSIVENALGDVFVTGFFSGTLDFDPNLGVADSTFTGLRDGFVIKLDQCPSSAVAVNPSGPVAICANSTVQLTANSAAGVTYQWYLDGMLIPGATSAIYQAILAGDYTVEIMSSCDTAVSIPVSVSVSPLPVSSVSAAGTTTFCNGGSVFLNATGSPGYTYQWMVNGTNISGATDTIYNSTVSGNFEVLATDTATGCSALSQNGIIVTVNPSPAALLTAATNPNICSGDSVLLNVFAPNAISYQWVRSNVNIPGANSTGYFAKSTGLYRCVVTDINGCTGSSNAIKVKIVCMPPHDDEQKLPDSSLGSISLYPNPASESLFLKMEVIDESEILIQMHDVLGKRCLHDQFSGKGDISHHVNIRNLPDGIYIFNAFVNGTRSASIKVVVH